MASSRKRKLRLKKNVKLFLAGVLVLMIAALIFTIPSLMKETDGNSNPNDLIQQEDEESETVSFPSVIEEGKLEIESLFQYTGLNPDCMNEEGNDLAAIELKNVSDQHLRELKLTMILEDETVIEFAASEIPSGKSAMIFTINNTSIKQDVKVKEIKSEAVFVQPDKSIEEKLYVSTEGIQIILSNLQDEELKNVSVYCHNLLEEVYFGGIAYSYTIESIGANQNAVIEAWDCFMGETEPVLIKISEGEE